MKWKVENALNRDVERQHLNKILKEIEAQIKDAAPAPTAQEVTRIVERIVNNSTSDALTSVTVNLSGDVSGNGTSNANGRIDITAVIDPSKLGITDAPTDSRRYWRINGTWEQVSDAIEGLADIVEPGIVVFTGIEGASYTSATLVGADGEIDVTNGDGLDLDDPAITVGLADVEPAVGGAIKTVEFDDKGRRIAEDEATTDDLPEGSTNLYHTDERAQQAVGSILESNEHISLDYDYETPSITATLINSNLVSIADVAPTDGDILEWQGSDNEWEVTRAPRVLHLDGGNF